MLFAAANCFKAASSETPNDAVAALVKIPILSGGVTEIGFEVPTSTEIVPPLPLVLLDDALLELDEPQAAKPMAAAAITPTQQSLFWLRCHFTSVYLSGRQKEKLLNFGHR
jgi:hypothetical protein